MGERRNGEDYPPQWSSLEIYPHPADSRKSGENLNSELGEYEVRSPFDNVIPEGDYIYKAKYEGIGELKSFVEEFFINIQTS